MCGELGLPGMCVPEEFGGKGLGAQMSARLLRGFAEGCSDLGLGFSVGAHAFGCARLLYEYGSGASLRAMLPRLARGELVGALAMTEQAAGSDIAAIATRAVRQGDRYVLNGEKIYVTNAPLANVFLIFAITAPEHGILGMSALVVERVSPGLEVMPPARKMGLAGSPMASIRLSDCATSVANRLGDEGQGREIFARAMEWERACLPALYLGMMERQLAEVVEHARGRHQFGRAIGKNQAIAHRIADMHMRLKSAELLVERACWTLDQGMAAGVEACVAKLSAAEAAVRSSLDAIHIFGAAGLLVDRGIEAYLRDAIPGSIFAGTPEILRDIIAARLLE